MSKFKRTLKLLGLCLLSAYPLAAMEFVHYRVWKVGLRGTVWDLSALLLSLFYMTAFGQWLQKRHQYGNFASTFGMLLGLAFGFGLLYLMQPLAV